MTKRCSKCGEVKPLEDYNRRKASADGRQSKCRDCSNAYYRAWHTANREYRAEYDRAWYQANSERKRAYYQANREQYAEYGRAYRQANPDKDIAKQHRRRARLACAVPQRWQVDHTLGDPLACWWCGRGLLGAVVHVEHVMPISLGGPAETANEVMSCDDCNKAKKAKHPLVWIAELVS